MRSGIKEFQPRQPLDRQLGATTLNQILRELESLRITRVVNGTFRKLPGGTEIVVAPPGGSAAIAENHPFKIFAAAVTGQPNSIAVSMNPGTINGLIASNWSQVRTLAKNAVHYIVLTANTDGQAITSTTWAEQATAPISDEPQKWTLATSLQILIGIVANGSVKQIISDNLTANGKKRLTTEKNNVTLGQIPYDNWYVWEIT